MINIAIDGPSGAGKSTLARSVARELGYVYVDTGALYRAIGLYMRENGVDPDDADAVIAALDGVEIELEYRGGEQVVLLGGRDVSRSIRTPEISSYASKVSSIPTVREFLLDLQRTMAREHDVVMDGRDIGTVILPDADVKIFLTASPEGRAKRRYLELIEKGEDVVYEKVLADMRVRDAADSTREVAPAVAAPDAVLLDNSDIGTDETLVCALELIKSKLYGEGK